MDNLYRPTCKSTYYVCWCAPPRHLLLHVRENDTNLHKYVMSHSGWVYSHLQGLVFLRRVCMTHTDTCYSLSIIQCNSIWNSLYCKADQLALHCYSPLCIDFCLQEGLYTFHWSTAVAGGRLCHAHWRVINTVLQDGRHVGVTFVCIPVDQWISVSNITHCTQWLWSILGHHYGIYISRKENRIGSNLRWDSITAPLDTSVFIMATCKSGWKCMPFLFE